MEQKEKYEPLEIEVLSFEPVDVITASDAKTPEYPAN